MPREDHPGELADSPRERPRSDHAAAGGVPGQRRDNTPILTEGERADDSTGQLHLWGTQLERVRAERERALADGDSRRAAELGHRAGRIRGDIERERRRLSGEAAPADAQLGRQAQSTGAALRGGASARGRVAAPVYAAPAPFVSAMAALAPRAYRLEVSEFAPVDMSRGAAAFKP